MQTFSKRLTSLSFAFSTPLFGNSRLFLARANSTQSLYEMQKMGLSSSSGCTMKEQGQYMVETRSDNNYIILHPKENVEHKYSIIWLHGLGDSAEGFSDVFLD